MTTETFILRCALHVDAKKIDEICENFDLDFDDELIYDLIKIDPSNLGNLLIYELFQQIVEEYKTILDEDKFDCFINGRDSHLYYDKTEIYNNSQLEDICETVEAEQNKQ